MSKEKYYYNRLLETAKLCYPDIESLNTNGFNIEYLLKRIIDAGNEYILEEHLLDCFIFIAVDYPQYITKLANLLEEFTTTDEVMLIKSTMDFYYSIFWSSFLGSHKDKLAFILEYKNENKIPLYKEFLSLVKIIDDKLYGYDYYLMRDIVNSILAYCLIHKKEDIYLDLCYYYVDSPFERFDELIENGLVEPNKDFANVWYVYYESLLNTSDEKYDNLIRYIINKLNSTKIRKKIN